jgi:Diguanylate cyclase, GGDEF domain
VSTNQRALTGSEGTFEGVDAQGAPGFFSYKSLPATRWLLATNLPLAKALAPANAAETRQWWISAGLAALLAPLIWLLTWRLLVPLLGVHDNVLRLCNAMAESSDTGRALAVMYLDIDHFKQINDTHGHAAGDALLLVCATPERQLAQDGHGGAIGR